MSGLRELLGNLSGIRETTVNPVTGSAVITYDPSRLTSKAILDTLAENRFFDPAQAVNNDQYLNSAAEKAGKAVGKAVLGAFVDRALAGSPFALLTVLI